LAKNQPAYGLFLPCITQSDGAVKHRLASQAVFFIGHTVTVTLNLETLL
jgi:hypothetical protein